MTSQSSIVKKKSSPCCIGCIALFVVAVIACVGGGIYGYKLWNENISFIDVASKPDPAIDATADQLMPVKVGPFERTAINDTRKRLDDSMGTATQGMLDDVTSGTRMVSAEYLDPQDNYMLVVGMSTKSAKDERKKGFGMLTEGRAKANVMDSAFSLRIPFSSDSGTIVTWQKPNWTFQVHTTSSLSEQFVKDFNPEK